MAAVREVHRMFKFGIEEEEMEYCKQLVLKELEDEATQEKTTNSSSLIDGCMTTFNSKSTFTSPSQTFLLGQRVMPTITLAELNKRVRHVLCHMEGICRGLAALPHFKIFVSASPSVSDLHRDSISEILGRSLHSVNRGSYAPVPNFLTDAEEAQKIRLSRDPFFVPVSDLRIDLDPTDWRPKEGKTLPLEIKEENRVYDPNNDSWITQLNNGMIFNHKSTTFEEKRCEIMLEMTGGKMAEFTCPEDAGCTHLVLLTLLHTHLSRFSEAQIDRFCNLYGVYLSVEADIDKAVITLEFNTINGGLRRAIEILHMVILQPLHNLKEYQPHFSGPSSFDEPFRGIESKAISRSKDQLALDWKILQNQMEEASYARLLKVVFPVIDQDRIGLSCRFWPLDDESWSKITLEKANEVLRRTWRADNMRLFIVGDYGSRQELEDLVLTYLGVIDCPPPSSPSPLGDHERAQRIVLPTVADASMEWLKASVPESVRSFPFRDFPFGPIEKDHPIESSLWLPDDESRAFVEIFMPSINHWGSLGPLFPDPSSIHHTGPDAQTVARRSHPLFPSRTLNLLTAV